MVGGESLGWPHRVKVLGEKIGKLVFSQDRMVGSRERRHHQGREGRGGSRSPRGSPVAVDSLRRAELFQRAFDAELRSSFLTTVVALRKFWWELLSKLNRGGEKIENSVTNVIVTNDTSAKRSPQSSRCVKGFRSC